MTSSRQMIVTLFIVAVSCAVVLSFVYAFTGPKIEKTKKNLLLQGLEQVIPGKEFKEIIPDTLWQVFDSLDNFVGIAFRVFPLGYGGLIPIIVGLDVNKKITGIKIAGPSEGLKETPGLGAKIIEPEFTNQFTNKSEKEIAIKKDGGEIDAITAATISSRAVCNGISKGIKEYFGYLVKLKKDERNSVFPEAQEFVEITKDLLWYAMKGGETLGIVFISSTFGYQDSIKFIIGLDTAQKITGVEILYAKETEGIGEKIKDREFLDKFKQEIPEAISGATISSQTLIDGVKEAVQQYNKYLR